MKIRIAILTRWFLELCLLISAFIHVHWSVASMLSLITIRNEIEDTTQQLQCKHKKTILVGGDN